MCVCVFVIYAKTSAVSRGTLSHHPIESGCGAHLGSPLKAGRTCFRITELFGVSSPWNCPGSFRGMAQGPRGPGARPKSSKPKIKEAVKNLQLWLP